MDYRYNGDHKRLFAAFIDNFIISILFYPLLFLSVFILSSLNSDSDMTILCFCSAIIFYYIFLYAFFYVIIPWKYNGQSIGKKLLKIRVIDYKGNNPSLVVHLLRILIITVGVNVVSIFYFLTILFTEKKQGIHDMLLKTYVVEK